MSDVANRLPASSADDAAGEPAAALAEAAPCSGTPDWTEAERLAALDRYAILDTGREPAFDDVAALAADLLDAPIAVVNLIAADRQWFKAEVGIGADTLPLDVSICRHALLQTGVFVVSDLTADPRFDSNPLVHVADGLRFYAGALLETPEGLPLGTVCVLDTRPRPQGLSERQSRALKVLASQTMARLELRRSEAVAKVERARAERHAHRLSLLSQASSLLLARNDPAGAVGELFGLIAEGFRLDAGFHYRCSDPDLRLVAAAGLTPEQERTAARIEFGQTVCGIVAATREPTHVTGIQASHDPHVQFLKSLGLDTYFSAPLVSGDGLFGTLSFGRREGPFSSGELEALRTLVVQFAMALERRKAEGELQESAGRLRLATENAEVGFWDVDPVNDRLIWPPRTKAMFGISADVPVSMADFYAGLHPEDRDRTAEAYAAAADPARRALYDVEYRTIGAEDGVVRWVAAKGRGVFDAAGVCVRVAGTAMDISERRRTEDRLASTENRYRTLFEAMDAGFCVLELKFDEDGRAIDYRHVEANPAFERQTGLKGIVGQWVREALPGLERRWFDIYGEVARTGRAVRFENWAEPLARWLDVHAFRIGAAQDRRVAVLFTDITERKQADDELHRLNETLEAQVTERTSELRFHRDIIEATTSPICAFDHDYRLIAFNKAHNDEFRRVNGFDTKLGDVFPNLFLPEQREVMRGLMSRALTGERFTVTEAFGRPEFGQPLWEIYYTPLRDAHGAVIGAFHLATDISDRLRAEAELAAAQEALRQSQKMEAMGSLTGGVAHDFNNLLTPIVGSLDMLQRSRLGGEREQRLIAGAVQSAERAKTLVQRLLAFARRQPLQPVPVDLAPLVRGMAELISSTTGPQIRVAVEAPDGLPPAKADPNQLEMAILNLAVNARDAMPNGGTLRISVEVEAVERQHRAGVPPGTYLKLSVADTGEGMDEATLKRAVEPFFSTKGVGKGTGLGLSMAHGLASQLGGALTITSARGLGTNIELWLPATAEARAPPNAPGDGQSLASGPRGTVLLVDDEELVRLSTADMLGELGYAVVEATSAEEALRLIAQGLRPDVLVTDHLMPGMSGADLARALRGGGHAVKVLVVSGYAETDGLDSDLPRLTKPFRSADLAASLAALA